MNILRFSVYILYHIVMRNADFLMVNLYSTGKCHAQRLNNNQHSKKWSKDAVVRPSHRNPYV